MVQDGAGQSPRATRARGIDQQRRRRARERRSIVPGPARRRSASSWRRFGSCGLGGPPAQTRRSPPAVALDLRKPPDRDRIMLRPTSAPASAAAYSRTCRRRTVLPSRRSAPGRNARAGLAVRSSLGRRRVERRRPPRRTCRRPGAAKPAPVRASPTIGMRTSVSGITSSVGNGAAWRAAPPVEVPRTPGSESPARPRGLGYVRWGRRCST